MNFVESLIQNLTNTYASEINEGLIDLIVPAIEFYPNRTFIQSLRDEIFQDDVKRIEWRVKQNFDITFLMSYSFRRGEFYLQVKI